MNDPTATAKRLGEKAKTRVDDTFERMTSAAEEATNAAQNTFSGVVHGAREFNLKVIEIARDNVNSTFDFVAQLLTVKSLPDLVDVSNAHARRQMDALPEQTRELTEAAQKMAKDTAEPFTSGFAKMADRAA